MFPIWDENKTKHYFTICFGLNVMSDKAKTAKFKNTKKSDLHIQKKKKKQSKDPSFDDFILPNCKLMVM